MDILAGQDLADLSQKAMALKANRNKPPIEKPETTKDVELMPEENPKIDVEPNTTRTITTITRVRGPTQVTTDTKEIVLFGPVGSPTQNDDDTFPGDHPKAPEDLRPPSPVPSNHMQTEDNNSQAPFLGLKVYAPKEVSVSIKGQLRHDMSASFGELTLAEWKSLAI